VARYVFKRKWNSTLWELKQGLEES